MCEEWGTNSSEGNVGERGREGWAACEACVCEPRGTNSEGSVGERGRADWAPREARETCRASGACGAAAL